MNSGARKEIVVGVVFLGILAVLFAFTVIIRGKSIFKPPEEFAAYFPRGVGGLREGNVVRISGLEVGQVEKMRLLKGGVLAHISVQSGVVLYPGYKITVRAFSPLGGKYVDIHRGDEKLPPLDYDLMKGRTVWSPELDFAPQTAFHMGPGPSQGLPLRGEVEAELITELAGLAETIRPDIEKAVANVRDMTDKMNQNVGTIGKLVGDPSLFDSLASAAANFERATASLASVLAKADSTSGTLGKLVADPALYDEATRAMSGAANIFEKVDQGQGVAGRLVNEGPMAQSIERTVLKIEGIIASLEATETHPKGKGTAGRFLHDDGAYLALQNSLLELRTMLYDINTKDGPVGVLVRDEAAGQAIQRTLASVESATANVEKVTLALAEGRGSAGRFIMDDKFVREAERVLVSIRESIEDTREQAPINAFIQAVFQAF